MDGCSAQKTGVGSTGTGKTDMCCKAVPAGGELGPGPISTDVLVNDESTAC